MYRKNLYTSIRSKLLIFLVFSFCLSFLWPKQIHADMGPKRSVTIDIAFPESLEGRELWFTLLSTSDSTGPYSAEREDFSDTEYGEERKTANSYFSDFAREHDLYYLHHYVVLDESASYGWTYYPPYVYKLAIHDPSSGKTFLTENLEKSYAFHSHYQVELSDLDALESGQSPGELAKDLQFTREAIAFAVRIVITIALELALAWLLHYRKRRQVRIIVTTNIITQVLLNLALAIILLQMGGLAYTFLFIPLEILVFIIEAIVYKVNRLAEPRDKEKLGSTIYAFLANLLSFFLGVVLYYFVAFQLFF